MVSQLHKGDGTTSEIQFDSLRPTRGVDVRPARLSELVTLARIARTTIPGAHVSDPHFRMLAIRDRRTVFAFRRNGGLVGGAAFLYLNYRGLDALILDEIDLHKPDPDLLAAPDEAPEAIYIWAIAGAGRSALGHISEVFSIRQYRHADIYTRPVTDAGLALFKGLKFTPAQCWSPDLWIYQRSANRPSRSLDLHHAA